MRVVTFCCMVILVILSWIQWDLLSASITSLFEFVWLGATNLDFAGYYRAGLAEYWSGALAWIATLLLLFFLTVRETPMKGRPSHGGVIADRSRAGSAGLGILGMMTFISLTCPFLVPVDPIAQGDLVTTRHLPPFSRGFVVHPPVLPAETDLIGAIGESYAKANSVILQRSRVRFAGGVVPPDDRGPSILFLLGTDDLGRDVFSRTLYGAKVSLAVGTAASFAALLIGAFIGFLAGMFPGWADNLLMRFTDMTLSIPSIFLVISLVAFLGPSAVTVVMALGLTGWMSLARIVRDEVRALREKEFILTARLFNVPTSGIIRRHMFPNLLPLLMTGLVLQFSSAVLAEAALGFLGLGIQPPTPSWGNMMGDATAHLAQAWWPGFFPGLLVSVVVVAAHYGVASSEKRIVGLSRFH